MLDLGAHHLDLMFTDARNPPCFYAAREVEGLAEDADELFEEALQQGRANGRRRR